MNRFALWQYLIIAVSLLLGALYTLPNFFGESPAVQISPLRTTVSADTALMQRAEDALRQAGLETDGIFLDEASLKIRFTSTDVQIKAKDLLESTLGNDYIIALNLLPNSPQWLTSLGALPMYLGLDLRGGVHFMLAVDMEDALDKSLDRYSTDIRGILREKRIQYTSLEKQTKKLIIKFRDAGSRSKAEEEIKQNYPDLGLIAEDTNNRYHLIAAIKPEAQIRLQDSTVMQNITTLRNRVNELGVAEPIIQKAGADRVIVQLPGVQDTAKAKDILGRTATLEVRMVDDEHDLDAAVRGKLPPGTELLQERGGMPILVKKQILLTGERITDAQPGFDKDNQAAVHVNLDNNGARIFKQITRDNVGRRMAILLIEKNKVEVVTAPVIREEIGGGRVQISGRMTSMEARDVALLLRAGALAAPMDIIEERTVGPSLGAENIARGFDSTLYGFLAIAIFISVYYTAFGVISVLALGLNLLLLVGILSILQATLTLPGMAALALTIGMAIDANVLINERIRDELRAGAPPQLAIHAGYERAFGTIVDSNITTLIAGIALFAFGSGPVKGFAVVLCLGILTSVFTATFVSRGMVNYIYGGRRLTTVPVGTVWIPKNVNEGQSISSTDLAIDEDSISTSKVANSPAKKVNDSSNRISENTASQSDSQHENHALIATKNKRKTSKSKQIK
ncbi:MAG: protein translocase subunit SecD [Nitrosomonas sp.]|nr:MAG: protein translocase subunit SecD [Nitrosomonas sp.]